MPAGIPSTVNSSGLELVSSYSFDFTKGSNDMIIHEQHCEPWKVTVVDTGLNTMTGGRIKRVQKYVGNEPFLMTPTLPLNW